MRAINSIISRNILRKIKKSVHTLLFFDYDGTLTPIVSKHNLAILNKKTANKLQKLTKNPHYSVGIISGRSLKNVRTLVKLKSAFYAGNHGLELEGPNFKLMHYRAVQFKSLANIIERKLAVLKKKFPGSYVENKGVTLTYHYRLMNPKFSKKMNLSFKKIVSPWVKKGDVKVTHAKMALEVRPNVNWNKGSAVRWILLQTNPEALPIYLGDDKTDEHAFRALNDRGITIRIGQDPKSSAKYFFKSQKEVDGLLDKLSQVKFKS